MSDTPFGFGPSSDDDEGKKEPAERESGEPAGGQENQFEAFNQLGQMLSQLGQMLSQAGTSSGPVNYELAKQIAVQRLTSGQAGFTPPADSSGAVADAVHLAEMWLDPGTILPAGASVARAC